MAEVNAPHEVNPRALAGDVRTTTHAVDAAVLGHETDAKLTHEEKHIGFWSGIMGWFNGPWMAQFFLLPSMLMRWVGLGKHTAVLRSVAHGTIQSLDLSLTQWDKIPGRALEIAAEQHEIVGNPKHAKRIAWLRESSTKVNNWMARRSEGARKLFAPVRSAIGNWADSIEGTGFGKKLASGLEWIAGKRATKNETNYANGVQEAIGHFGKDGQKGLFRKWKPIEKYPELAELHRLLGEAEALPVGERAAKMAEIADHAKGLLSSRTLPMEAAQIVADVHSSVLKTSVYATAAVEHAAAAGKSLRVLLKNAGKMVGRTSWMGALITGATVVGVYVAAKTAQHKNNIGAATLDDMAKDIGDKNHPYLTQVRAAHNKNKPGQWAAAGLESASQVMFMNTMGASAGGMADFGTMGVAGLLPEVGKYIVKDNEVLNAYANLKSIETGHSPAISPADKTKLVHQLVGAVPVVAAKGGTYNRLAAPVAAKIVEKNLSLRDTMQLLTDNARFTALARDAKAEMDAAKAEQPKVKDEPQPVTQAAAGKPPMIENKPSMMVSADRAHQGMLAQQNLALNAQ